MTFCVIVKKKKDDKNNNPTSWSCVVLMGGSASERSLVIFSATTAGSESCSKEVTKREENNTNTAQLVQINNILRTVLNLRAFESFFHSNRVILKLNDGTTIVFLYPSNTIFQDKIDITISKPEKTNRKQFPKSYILFNHRNDVKMFKTLLWNLHSPACLRLVVPL